MVDTGSFLLDTVAVKKGASELPANACFGENGFRVGMVLGGKWPWVASYKSWEVKHLLKKRQHSR